MCGELSPDRFTKNQQNFFDFSNNKCYYRFKSNFSVGKLTSLRWLRNNVTVFKTLSFTHCKIALMENKFLCFWCSQKEPRIFSTKRFFVAREMFTFMFVQHQIFFSNVHYTQNISQKNEKWKQTLEFLSDPMCLIIKTLSIPSVIYPSYREQALVLQF